VIEANFNNESIRADIDGEKNKIMMMTYYQKGGNE